MKGGRNSDILIGVITLPRISHAALTRVALVALIGLGTLSANCARVPATDVTGGGKLLVVSFTTRGPIDVNRTTGGAYYFVVINRTDDRSVAGPVPVVGTPWGNGFAAPASSGSTSAQGFVAFVSYLRNNGTSSNYAVRTSTNAEGNLILPVQVSATNAPSLGEPDFVEPVAGGGSRISFRLQLRRLPLPDTRYLQLNIIATDKVPQGADDTPKSWDALGDGRDTSSLSSYISIDTTNTQIITNDQQISPAKEPANDVRDRINGTVDDPALDIVDWSVQVRDS